VGVLYLDTIPFKLVSLSIVWGFYSYPDIKTPTMDKLTNLKVMVSRYKNPTMDKHTDLKGMVSRYKKPTQC
jgi:hypothetical protein